MSTPNTSTPSPLASTITPAPAVILPVTASAAPAAPAAPSPTPAPTGSVFGDFQPGDADDELLNYAVQLGMAGDLGLTAAPAKSAVAPAAPAGEVVAPVAPAALPANESAADKLIRLEAEAAALRKVLVPAGTPPEGGAAAPVVPASLFPVVPPTAETPLINLRTAGDLDAQERLASDLKAWSVSARGQGGELPIPLAQRVEDAEALRPGRTPRQITAPWTLDAEATAHIESSAGQMLELHVPSRRRELAGETGAMGIVAKDHPQFLDAATDEGKIFATVIREMPMLRTLPNWPLMARDLVTGYLANRPKAAAAAPATSAPAAAPVQMPAPTPKPTVPTADGKQVPLAPDAATGGLSFGGAPVSQTALDAADKRLQDGTASEQDLILLSASAV